MPPRPQPRAQPRPSPSRCTASTRPSASRSSVSTTLWSPPRKRAGENVSGSIDSFTTFVQKKTEQIRKQYHCENVEYSVELANGHVKLKAKAKT